MYRKSLILLLLILHFEVFAQKNKLYTPADGLSNISFAGITQDRNGNIWIATDGGVNKFNGYDFEVYSNDPLDTNSLQSNLIECVFTDSYGKVWASSSNGLYYFDVNKNNFQLFPLILDGQTISPKVLDIVEDSRKTLWLGSTLGLISVNLLTGKTEFKHPVAAKTENRRLDPINVLKVDKQGNLWIGTDGYGLRYYNTITKQSVTYKKGNPNSNSLSDNLILSLLIDSKGNIIIGTIKEGISILDPITKDFKTVPLSNNPENKFNGGVYSIIEDKSGTIWVGTERNGVKILELETLTLRDANRLMNIDQLSDSKVLCFQDRDENLWLSIEYKGVYLKKAFAKPFHSIVKNKQAAGLNHDIIKSLLVDSDGQLLIGTDGGGLNVMSPNFKENRVYQHFPGDSTSISDNAIITIFEDKRKNIWIGSYLGGLSLFNKKEGTFTNYHNDSVREGSNYNFFSSIISDSVDNLLIGTIGVGIYHFDVTNKTFTSIQKVKIKGKWYELPKYINKLCKDNEDGLWIASYNGLYYLNKRKGIFKVFTRKNKGIKSDEVYDVLLDSKNNIWVATSYGIHVFDRVTGGKTYYDTKSGLSSNRVHGLVEEPGRYMWISTDNGLSRFSYKDKNFIKYYTQDGLAGNKFLPTSHCKSKEGNLFFGTTSGVVYFSPDSIEESKKCPKLFLSKLKLFNEEVRVGEKEDQVILSKPIDEAKSIHLKHSDNSFTIEFAAVDYTVPEKIEYAYLMEGFDNNWNFKNYKERSATYTNLNPGTYTFKVKCTNSDGIWSSDVRTIEVVISPPWWQTWWAYLLYLVLAVVALYVTRRLMLMRWQMKNQLILERIEREKGEEINQSKLRFFTNISHEFRTPLTLILAPVEKLLTQEGTPGLKKHVKLIHTNALRMLRMFNQLLELQKLEENKMELNAQPGDLTEFVKNIIEPFEDLCVEKGILLTLDVPSKPVILWFDFDKLDKVLFNLLSNAFKFTDSGGEIKVKLEEVSAEFTGVSEVEISISDTGKGISKEYYEKIFHRFYQLDDQTSKNIHGTGIGLHLAQSLVELHKGHIMVESEEGKGSTFIVRLPVNCSGQLNSLEPDLNTKKPAGHNKEEIISEIEEFNDKPQGPYVRKESYKVLIVDDDRQILHFLRSELSEEYMVFEAMNGKEGLEIAQRELPHLIISDIMMPEMDGIEFCREIKLDINTCHIPVILLTAKSTIENRIEGLETGADSYIPKPFHLVHLKTRIEKLIELRENLKKKFSKSMSFDAKDVTIMSADEKLIQKAVEFVKDNISDSELNIEDMGKQLGMSRAQLYRKIKSLTDKSPSEFVRTIRLKQAAYLLSQNKMNISEVAYQVGFSSPQYFTNSFRDLYDMSPSEYCQKVRVEMSKG